jgi:hypothetical protein
MIIGLIKSALKSLELFLKLKNKTVMFDLQEKHDRNRERLIEEIENLRATGDSNDAIKADILLEKLIIEDERFEYLTDIYNSQNDNDASKI